MEVALSPAQTRYHDRMQAWQRRLGHWLGGAVALLVLLTGVALATALLAWRSQEVRGALLRAASARLEAATGVRVTAADVRLRPFAGELELWQLAVARPGAPPFATAARVFLRVDAASLRRGAPVVRLLVLEAPQVDLSQPLPPPPPATGGGTPQPPPVLTVERLVVTAASVRKGEIPAPLKGYLSSWHLADLEAEGALQAGTARLELRAASLVMQPRGGEPQSFSLHAAGELRDGRSWRLSQLSLQGAGLEVKASGAGEFSPHLRGETSFNLLLGQSTALPPQLAPIRAAKVTGEVTFFPLQGQIQVDASLDGDSLAPLLPAQVATQLRLAGTGVAITAAGRFALPADQPAIATGEARATWRRDQEELVALQLRGDLSGPGARAQVEMALLPDLPGQRRLAGAVHLPSLDDPTAANLEGLTLTVAEPDLAATLAALTRRWPGLLPPLPSTLPLRGGVDLAARLDGAAADPTLHAQLSWRPGDGEELRVWGRGRPRARQGSATVQANGLRLATLGGGTMGTVSATAQLAASPAGFRARFTVDAAGLGVGERWLDYLHLEGEADGQHLRLERVALLAGGRELAGRVRAGLPLPLREADVQVELTDPAPGVSRATLAARLREGVVDVELSRLDTLTGTGWLAASVPLGALRPVVGDVLDRLPVVLGEGPVVLQAALPALDSCALAPLLPALDRPERLRTGVEVALAVDPNDPTAASGEVRLTDLTVDGNGGRLAETAAARVVVGGRRVVLGPLSLTAAGTTLSLEGEAQLAPTWRPGQDPPHAAVASFQASARGTLEAALLQPYLAGAAASGPVHLEARLEGTPSSPRAGFTLDGTGASLFWITPYAARLDGFVADGGLTASGDALLTAGGHLNGGRMEVVASRAADGRVEAFVELARTRFRLDFGVLVELSGQLVAELPPQGRSRVHGTLTVARGRLDRPLSLRHELLPFLLAPPTTAGTAGGVLGEIDLDVAVRTDDGVRVRNNLADLRVRWDDLYLRGTAWSPHLEGVVSVEPGGVVRAWGQTLRLDRAVATFTGDPLSDPQLELSVTSSLDDPDLQREGRGALALLEEEQGTPPAGVETTLTLAAAGAVGGTLAASLSESLGGAARIVVEPVLVFGEADPSARLTVARDISTAAAFAVSLDLRNAERQTYLLDLHNLPSLPFLTAQVFTNDEGNAGVTVQQTLQLGGTTPRQESSRPTLRRVQLQAPPGISRRHLRRAIGLAPGDPLPEGVEVDVELELEHQLRQQGFPDGDIRVALVPVAGRRPRADLAIRVDPGPPVAIVFAGEVPPAGSRPLITALYRSGLWEAGALEEMRRAAVRVWRSLSYPEPTVTVAVTPARGDTPRTVTVTSVPGRRWTGFQGLRVEGVDREVEEQLRKAFGGTVEVMELAAAVPEADARLRTTMATLGFPEARLMGRSFDPASGVLTLSLQPGPRQRWAAVEFTGIPAAHLAEVRKTAGLVEGQAARRDEAAAAAVRIAEWYRSRGHTDVGVRPVVAPDPADPLAPVLTFEITPGAAFTVAGVELGGTPRTSPQVAKRLAGVPVGEPLRLDVVREGRRRLLATGLYAAVGEEVLRSADGDATVRFHLTERPPISLAYGLRWESSQGGAAVVDYVDRNLLGRALTFGARALYESNHRAGRLYLSAPDVLGTGVRSEAFLEQRRRLTAGGEILPDLVEDTTRFTFQLSRPLGRHWVARTYGRWQRTHLFERSDFFPLDITLTLPYAGFGLAYDSRDNKVLTQRGVLANLDISGTGSVLGADLTFVRLYAQLAGFSPLGQVAGRPLTWATSLRLGLAETGGGQELIRSERFFAGGEYSVRGYPTESLGPQEDLGFIQRPLGGGALLVLNQELRVALPLDLTGVVFVDAGGVWETPSTVRLGEVVMSTGVGLRASTPLGVLRLDTAFPLHRRPTDPRYKLYLGFGSTF